MRLTSALFAALSLLSFITATPFGDTVARHEDYGNSVYVHAGQSIQAAIDKASEGTEIVIEAGTYSEHLTVQKDGLTITSRPDARLVPPETFTDNLCTGLAGSDTSGFHPLQAGICIHGSNIHPATS
ncbi:hypothetical protein LTS10_013081 [Elasticomyces elasticus]|nr:hypothetical protein LTS10_013081 [Elasticomyces elasticus]